MHITQASAPTPPRAITAAEADPSNPAVTLALASAAAAMHGALLRVADLWGPCPAGADDAAIFVAGPEFGTLADLRAVEAALATVEGRAGE
jgi:hypothetical protein